MVRNSLNRPWRHTSVHNPELSGRLKLNVIIPFEQTSELSNDSNDDTTTDHVSEYENSEQTIHVATSITPVLIPNLVA